MNDDQGFNGYDAFVMAVVILGVLCILAVVVCIGLGIR